MNLFLFALFLIPSLAFGAVGWSGNVWNADSFASGSIQVTATADDQIIDASDHSVLELSSDNAVAVNRDIILECPKRAGQSLTIYFSGGNAARLEDNKSLNGACGGTAKLGSNWTAATDGTLSLISTSTDYLEVGRTSN